MKKAIIDYLIKKHRMKRNKKEYETRKENGMFYFVRCIFARYCSGVF